MVDAEKQHEFGQALQSLREQQDKLLQQQQALIEQITAPKPQPRKDIWDRLAAIAPVLSGTIIAIGGTFFTLSYNEQQLKLQEVQTIEKFIPHLLGDEKSKRAAILAISSLADTKLAAKMASIFASPGTVSALESIAENDTGTDRKALKSALAKALDTMAGNYMMDKKYDDAIAAARKALDMQEQSFGASSPELVPNLNRISELCTINKDYAGAESSLKRSTDIQKATFGADSKQYASQLHRLATLYQSEGIDSKAQDALNQAIAIEQKLPGNAGATSTDTHNEKLVDHKVGSGDSSTAGSEKQPSAITDAAADTRSISGDTDSTTRGTSDSSSGRTAGQERTKPIDTRGQDISPKSYDNPQSDSSRLHESSMLQPGRAEASSEKLHDSTDRSHPQSKI